MRALVALTKLNDLTGSETYSLDLVEALVDAGWDVDVFTILSSRAMEDRVSSLGARLHTYPSYPPTVPDRVVTMHPLATFLLLRKLPRHVPTLAVILGITRDEAPTRLDRVDRFVAVSPLVADRLVAHYRVSQEDVVVIPNGIDLQDFHAPSIRDEPRIVRVLWASTYIPLRHSGLVALIRAVQSLESVTLTIVNDNLPPDLAVEGDRITLVEKSPRVQDLITRADVVVAVGPGRVLLEALAMNRAALCLNVQGRGEYMASENRDRLEYYLHDWGAPIETLLDPPTVFAHQNQRSVVAAHFDAQTNFGLLEAEMRQLGKTSRRSVRSLVNDAARAPFLARSYAYVRFIRRRRRETSNRGAQPTGRG